MSEFLKNQKMIIITECDDRQLCSNQDIAAILTIENEEGQIKEEGDEPIDIIAVWDGHGPNLVIDIIKSQNLQKHFASSDPAESLQKIIDDEIKKKKEEYNTFKYKSDTSYHTHTRNKITDKTIFTSGATFSFAKIYRNTYTNKIKIVAEWLGDSPIIIFINNKLIFQSKNHDVSNEGEIERLQQKGVLKEIKKSLYGFKVINEDTIVDNHGKYITFNNKYKDSFAMTRSLGHNRITDVETQKKIIECSTNDEIKIIIFSDGVGDILNMDMDLEKLKTYSAEEIVEFAENRWKQEWNYKDKKIKFPCYSWDDCCCAIWCQKLI
jgi:serine/threonine protein phosphatase PrpC